MVPHNRLRLAFVRQVQPTQPVNVPALLAHQVPEWLHPGGLVHFLVKGLVSQRQFRNVQWIQRGFLQCQMRVQTPHQFVVLRLGQLAQRRQYFQLDRAAQEMRLQCRRQVNPAHDRGMLRKDVHQLLFAQAQQGVPITPPAPPMFSTTKGCLRIFPSSSATSHPITALVPPAGKGTMILTGLFG